MKKLFLIGIVILTVITGCSAVEESNEEVMTLKIGVMPAVDSAPIYIAQDQGFFQEEGLEVEIQLFTNAQDRQSALQTNSIDGAMSDMIALITNVQSGFEIKGTTLTDGLFPVLVNPDFNSSDSATVAMMEVSVSNYLADQWLSERYQVEKVFINEIPARLEMIKNGNVDMGIFPEPMATMGTLNNLEKVFYEIETCPDVFVFTQKAIDEKSKALVAYHAAINRAVEAIQKDEGMARDVLIEKLNLNPDIRDLMDLPEYQETHLPDEAYILELMAWTSATIGKEIDIEAEAIFERKFVE